MIDTGIKLQVLDEIRASAQRYGLVSVILFGSRARGDHRAKSDIDLALSGGDQVKFVLDVEQNVSTLLRFDFVNLDGPVQQELRDVITREGLTLYEKI